MSVRILKHLQLYSTCFDHTLVKDADILTVCICLKSPNKCSSKRDLNMTVQSKMSLKSVNVPENHVRQSSLWVYYLLNFCDLSYRGHKYIASSHNSTFQKI